MRDRVARWIGAAYVDVERPALRALYDQERVRLPDVPAFEEWVRAR